MTRLFLLLMVGAASAISFADNGPQYQPVDLQPYATQKRGDGLGRGLEGNNLANLPAGEQSFAGTKFIIADGILHLGSNLVDRHPEKVLGIKVNSGCKKLHFLHATCFGGGPNKPGDPGYAKDGTVIGQYMIRYADGSGEGISIVYGEDVRDWFYVDEEAETSRGKVAWQGENDWAAQNGARIRLYLTSWDNTHPDKQIASIDFLGKKSETPCAPFCVAISLEK
jgi:hypothetical protein